MLFRDETFLLGSTSGFIDEIAPIFARQRLVSLGVRYPWDPNPVVKNIRYPSALETLHLQPRDVDLRKKIGSPYINQSAL
jgi:hypothetical protein